MLFRKELVHINGPSPNPSSCVHSHELFSQATVRESISPEARAADEKGIGVQPVESSLHFSDSLKWGAPRIRDPVEDTL